MQTSVKSSLFGLFLFLNSLFFLNGLSAQSHNWNSPSEVVKKIKKKFVNIKSYTAEFRITTVSAKKTTNMRGNCTYKSPGKIRYDFNEPEGDAIVSDGKTLWIYIKRIGAVGKQDLELKKNNTSGPIFQAGSAEGLNRLFRKYHYKFDSISQPQVSPKDGKQYFVLALEQREKVGGYENMLLYVDAESYLIKKAIAADGRGKETTIDFSEIKLDPEIEDGIFNYHISGNAKIVNNPLVSDN
ncbi:MAG: outer membrane lipoprotein carrier protein LolA [Leptospira sp.]|nr:outer membrane lipoprotein carrier protein LolA [Leptospira sp.]